MRDFLQFWRYYRHPSQRWMRDIKAFLKQLPEYADFENTTLVDAPCGDGVISFWLIKSGIGQRFEMYDLSDKCIANSRRLLDWNRAKATDLTIEVRNVHEVPVAEPADDIWLLINSLYLLPDVDQMVERMRPRAKTIIGLFPNIASSNYQSFTSQFPDMNINEMSVDDTIEFFAKHGYRMEEKRDIDCFKLHQIKSKYSKLFVSYVLNPVEGLFGGKEPCYWVARFTRT